MDCEDAMARHDTTAGRVAASSNRDQWNHTRRIRRVRSGQVVAVVLGVIAVALVGFAMTSQAGYRSSPASRPGELGNDTPSNSVSTGPAVVTDGTSLPITSQLFSLPESTRLDTTRVIDYSASKQSWSVGVDGQPYTIDISTATFLRSQSVPYPDVNIADSQHLSVDGHVAYLGCAGHSSDPSYCSSTVSVLAWQFNGTDWAQIVGKQGKDSAERMLWLAHSMNFSVSSPNRVPMKLVDPPAGVVLSELVIDIPVKETPSAWSVIATYSSDDAHPGGSFTINVNSLAVPTDRPDGYAINVDGRTGWWSPSTDDNRPTRLWLQTQSDKTILILGDPATKRSLADFEELALSVRLASNPDDRGGWFDATSALR